MKKSAQYITFVGKYEETAYINTYDLHIINTLIEENTKKYSLAFISEEIEVLEIEEPIIKIFKQEISNAQKEAYLALLAYKKMIEKDS